MKDDAGSKKRRDKGDEGTGHGVLGFHLGKKRTTRPTTADTLVAAPHDEKDNEEKPGILLESSRPDTADTTASALEQPQNEEEPPSRRISWTPQPLNLNSDDADYPVHLYDDDDSDNNNGNDNDNNEIQEVPRGREGRGRFGMSTSSSRLPSGSSLVSLGMGRMAENPRRLSSTPPPPPPISPILLTPISSSMNIPSLPNSSNSTGGGTRSRPRTAPTTTTATTTISPSPLAAASAPASRPGTGDSTVGVGPIRHHRLDSIRGAAAATIPHHIQGHRTPPTRDSSPSRSVRFVDYVDGESGHVGPLGPVAGNSSSGGGGVGGGGNLPVNDNEGRVVTVVEIPPPTPSRSSSFTKKNTRNGRTLVGGGLEGEEEPDVSESVSGSGSVPTSRPPTR